MLQMTKMLSRSRPARGSRSFNHLNFHQKQLAILKFAEAPATSRIGAMIQHSSNSLCICDSMSNARKTGAQQSCKPLAILGLASPGNAHFPAAMTKPPKTADTPASLPGPQKLEIPRRQPLSSPCMANFV
jgi:hypothetical protein